MDAWLVTLTQQEMAEDPHDPIATHLPPFEGHLSDGSETFAALYLLAVNPTAGAALRLVSGTGRRCPSG